MNLLTVAQQMDARLATLPGLNAHYIGARKSVSVPCSIVLLPEPIDYLQTYGADRRVPNWEIVILTGLVDDVSAPERILRYSGDGEGTVLHVLQTPGAPFEPYTGCAITLKTCEFGVIDWQGQSFQGATFAVDVMTS